MWLDDYLDFPLDKGKNVSRSLNGEGSSMYDEEQIAGCVEIIRGTSLKIRDNKNLGRDEINQMNEIPSQLKLLAVDRIVKEAMDVEIGRSLNFNAADYEVEIERFIQCLVGPSIQITIRFLKPVDLKACGYLQDRIIYSLVERVPFTRYEHFVIRIA